MADRRIPVAALLLGACAAACGQDPVPALPPAARLAPAPGAAVIEVMPPAVIDPSTPAVPPLLVVPPPAVAPRKPCLPCHTNTSPATSTFRSQSNMGPVRATASVAAADGTGCRWPVARWQPESRGITDLNCGVQGGAGYHLTTPRRSAWTSASYVHKPYSEIFFDAFVNSPLTVDRRASVRMELLTQTVPARRAARLPIRPAARTPVRQHAGGFAAERTPEPHSGCPGRPGRPYRYGGYFCELSEARRRAERSR